MENAVIIDIVLAALLLGAVIFGAVRGLYRSVAGLLVLVLALAGAAWLTETCAAGVEDCVRPVLTERMEALVSEAVAGQLDQTGGFSETELFSSAEALLQRFGWEGDLGETVQQSTADAIRGAEAALAAALLESLLPAVVRTALQAVFFLLLLLVLWLVSRLIRPLFERLPVIRQCNSLLGAAAGLIQGILLIWLILWFARKTGFLAEKEELLAGTRLLGLFMR